MRPMNMEFTLTVLAACGLLVVFPLGVAAFIVGWRDRRARQIALLAIVFAITATCLGFELFDRIVAARHFVIEG